MHTATIKQLIKEITWLSREGGLVNCMWSNRLIQSTNNQMSLFAVATNKKQLSQLSF